MIDTLVERIEEVLAHSMPDTHKLPRIAALVETYRKQQPKPNKEDIRDESRPIRKSATAGK